MQQLEDTYMVVWEENQNVISHIIVMSYWIADCSFVIIILPYLVYNDMHFPVDNL